MIRVSIPRHLPANGVAFAHAAPALCVLGLVVLACVVALAHSGGGDTRAVVTILAATRGATQRLPQSSTTTVAPVGTQAPARLAPLPSAPTAAVWYDPILVQTISDALADSAGAYSVVVQRLSDGRSAAYQADAVFYAASTFKLAVLYAAERRLSDGLLRLDDRLQLAAADYGEDLGTAESLEVGRDGTISMGDALHAMITRSDNASAVAMLHLFGGANIDRDLALLGLDGTSVNTHDLPTTAADMAGLMVALLTDPRLSSESRAHIRELLLAQETRWGIPSLLPEGVAVGNKTGTWAGATHDVAFVDAPGGTYVVAILTDGDWAWEPIARVSAAIYAAMAYRRSGD